MRPLLLLLVLLLSAACARVPFTAEPPIRVLVLNVHGAGDVNAIAGVVTTAGADLVLLQEVDPAALNPLGTKLQYASAGGNYGLAVLARGFIGFNTSIPLTVTPAGTAAGGSSPSARAALQVLASLRKGQFAAIDTQIDPSEGRVGDQDVARLADGISAQRATGTPLVVGGDFNATPDHPGLARLEALGLRDAWAECGSGDGFTYPSTAPAKRIDYLFLSGDLHCSAATVMETQVSDHRPLLVTLK